MKKIFFLIFCVFMIAISAVESRAQVAPSPQFSVSPSSLRVPYGQSATVSFSYRYSIADAAAVNPTCLVQTTGSGNLFFENIYETYNRPVSFLATRTGTGYSGVGTEVITISAGTLEKARRDQTNTLYFDRNFSDCYGNTWTSRATILITADAGADFSVNRIELYFENRRPETTVERNSQQLKAYADIRFTGSGLLEGYWEVDGRILSRVFQHLTYGRIVTLKTPDMPSLPTFNEGSHVVRFVISKPETVIPLPMIVYFVTPKTTKMSPVPLKLIAPEDSAATQSLPLKFEWDKGTAATMFLISFYEQPAGTPIFSAFTRESFYVLPGAVVSTSFNPGKKYFWKVTGFSDETALAAESSMASFFIGN